MREALLLAMTVPPLLLLSVATERAPRGMAALPPGLSSGLLQRMSALWSSSSQGRATCVPIGLALRYAKSE